MPDDTPQTGQRRTAMQVAQDALELAQTLDEANRQLSAQLATAVQAAHSLAESARTEADNAVGLIEGLSEKVTDLSTRIADLSPDLAGLDPSLFATRDQVDGRIGEALDPINEHLRELGAAVKMATPKTVLDALKEETGGYMGAVNRKLDDLRTRVAGLEESTGTDMPPGDDQKPYLTQEVLDGLLARIEALETRPAADASNPGLTWDAIAERVTNQAKVEVQKHLALIAPAGTGAGPAKPRGVQAKVLGLMRTVDSIGKDRKAEKSAGGYNFRGIDEAMDAVGHAMRQIGLIGSPEVRSVEYDTNYSNNSLGRSILWTTARVVGAYVFTDPVDGSTHRIELVGEGRDNSDKATSKASSMALKYGLLHGLMIPVRGMSDGDAENPEVAREPEATTTQRATPPPGQPVQEASPQERAQRAVAAFQGLNQITDSQERYNRFVSMNNHARKAGLIDLEVEWKGQRAPLHYFVSAVEHLLWPKTNDAPPADEPPPWDGN